MLVVVTTTAGTEMKTAAISNFSGDGSVGSTILPNFQSDNDAGPNDTSSTTLTYSYSLDSSSNTRSNERHLWTFIYFKSNLTGGVKNQQSVVCPSITEQNPTDKESSYYNHNSVR